MQTRHTLYLQGLRDMGASCMVGHFVYSQRWGYRRSAFFSGTHLVLAETQGHGRLVYGGALRVLAEIGTRALRIWGAHRVFSKAGHRRSAYEQGGGDTLRSQGSGTQAPRAPGDEPASHRVLPKAKHRLQGRKIHGGSSYSKDAASRTDPRMQRLGARVGGGYTASQAETSVSSPAPHSGETRGRTALEQRRLIQTNIRRNWSMKPGTRSRVEKI